MNVKEELPIYKIFTNPNLKFMLEIPVKETEDQIVIDKKKVESLTKRFLAALKAFFLALIGAERWQRMGLERTWRFFLPLVAILFFYLVHIASYFLAFGVLILTAVWLYRAAK